MDLMGSGNFRHNWAIHPRHICIHRVIQKIVKLIRRAASITKCNAPLLKSHLPE
jgi:hypothetical protein